MADADMNTAVNSFVDRIKEIARQREAARANMDPTVEGYRPPVESAQAVAHFRECIMDALKGNQVAADILEGVSRLLKDMGIQY